MQTQSIFQAGNSTVVAIPKHLLKEQNLELGQKVVVDKGLQEGEIIIKKVVDEKKTKDTMVKKDFKKWVGQFLKEDAEILDELAVR